MKTRSTVLGLSLILLLATANSGLAAGTGKIKLMITGFKTADGIVRVVLVNSKESYLKDAGQETGPAASVKVGADMKAQYTFDNVAYGAYVIKIYHDVNNNNKLDKNMLGIPKEPYGFSNNARGKMGLPSYDAVTFQFNAPEQVLQVEVK